MTSMQIIGAIAVLGFHSLMVLWTYRALTFNRTAVWQDAPRSFFFFVTIPAALIFTASQTGKVQ